MAQWKFKPLAVDDMSENPIQSQFFTTEGVGNIANALVREAIQNSLDERKDVSKAVIIKITLPTDDSSIPPSVHKLYLDELVPHLQAKDNGLRNLPDFTKDKMAYLVIEDFNTKGLRGDPYESKDVDIKNESKSHNFHYFWRSFGISGKQEKNKLGRWGVGKTVFAASSRINTFWGLTIQSDTSHELLLGQSTLKKHNPEKNPKDWGYSPYGYYGIYKKSFRPDPVIEKSDLESFKRLFKLTRTSEPGLSVIIPFPKTDITLNSIKSSVLKQYFYAILKNDLIVHIIHNETELIINKESIRDIAKQVEDLDGRFEENEIFANVDFRSLIDFAEWSIKLEDDQYTKFIDQPIKNKPRWNKRQLLGNIDLEKSISSFENKERLAFKVPVKYRNILSGDIAKNCWFKVFIERDEKLKKSEEHFIREYITIVDVKSLHKAGVRCIVLIEDEDLSNLLGDAENPAHTNWQKDSEHFVNKYEDGEECLKFISSSPQKIFEFLQPPATGIDNEILKSLFYIEDKQEDNDPIIPKDNNEENEVTVKPTFPELEPSVQHVLLNRVEGGFRLYSKDLTSDKLPTIRLKMAYMTTRGKPFKKYRPFDFEVDKAPINVNGSGYIIRSQQKNEIELEVIDTDFEITIKGFDNNRDLFIKMDPQFPENNDKEI